MPKATFEDVQAIVQKLNTIGGSPLDAASERSRLMGQLRYYAEHPEECDEGVAKYIRELLRLYY
jgi:hypothetical protein